MWWCTGVEGGDACDGSRSVKPRRNRASPAARRRSRSRAVQSRAADEGRGQSRAALTAGGSSCPCAPGCCARSPTSFWGRAWRRSAAAARPVGVRMGCRVGGAARRGVRERTSGAPHEARSAALLLQGGGRSQLDQRQRRPDAAPAHGCVGLKTEAPVPIPLAIEHHHRQPSHPEHGFTVASWPLGGQGGRRFSACLAVGRALSKRKTHTRVPPRRTSSGSHGPLVMSSYSCPFMLSGPSIRGPAGLGPPKSVRVSLLL